VALDGRKLFDGGIGTYIRGLFGALAASYPRDEWILLVDPGDRGRVRWPGSVDERPVRAGKYGLLEHFAVPAEARRAGAELLHAPHYTLPLAWRGPCSRHDPRPDPHPLRALPPAGDRDVRAVHGRHGREARRPG
jgi:hypothetical protein